MSVKAQFDGDGSLIGFQVDEYTGKLAADEANDFLRTLDSHIEARKKELEVTE